MYQIGYPPLNHAADDSSDAKMRQTTSHLYHTDKASHVNSSIRGDAVQILHNISMIG